MDHYQAMEQKLAERYLLNELTPDSRDAFEEHLFECPECALDLRAGAAFIDEAKLQLPGLVTDSPLRAATAKPKPETNGWLAWLIPALRPSFAVPAFAALLLLVGYQNVVTLPALRATASEPRLVPVVPTHGATRGSAHSTVVADRKHGASLPLDIVPQPGMPTFTSYSVELSGAQHKLIWTGAYPAPADGAEVQLSLDFPGAALNTGSYTVSVVGLTPQGLRTDLQKEIFDIHFTD